MLKVASAALCMALLLAGSLWGEEHWGPRLVLDQTHLHLGDIVQGNPAIHTFEFRNEGTIALVIDRVQAS